MLNQCQDYPIACRTCAIRFKCFTTHDSNFTNFSTEKPDSNWEDITRKLKARVSCNSEGRALIYLTYMEQNIVLWDADKCISMGGGNPDSYRIVSEDRKVVGCLRWFRVYKRKAD